jgi:hypothetical protein
VFKTDDMVKAWGSLCSVLIWKESGGVDVGEDLHQILHTH